MGSCCRALIVKEAGGFVTLINGEPFTACHRNVLAKLVKDILDKLNSVH